MKTLELRFLDDVLGNNPDYKKLMTEVCGYKPKSKLHRRFLFVRHYKRIRVLINLVRKTDLSKLPLADIKGLERPGNIDDIPFIAMTVLVSTIINQDISIQEKIIKCIALVTFQVNTRVDLEIDSQEFEEFQHKVSTIDIIEAMPLYRWIEQELEKSNTKWEGEFLAVEYDDPDYEEAGGRMMSRFNVVNSLKILCRDFNVNIDKAWQISYGVAQTNSLSNATSAFIQHRMSQIKEKRMKSKNQN